MKNVNCYMKIERDSTGFDLFLLNCRFINKHDRNFIANRIDAMTAYAFQCAAVGFQFDFRFAGRTPQYFQKIRTNAHRKTPRGK